MFTKDDGTGDQIVSGKPQTELVDGEKLYIRATSLVQDGRIQVFSSINPKRVLDSIRITTFFFKGPSDVPQFGTYDYSVTKPQPTQANGCCTQMVAILSTRKATLLRRALASGTDALVRWGTGAAVGAAAYMASTDFVWDYSVNIVAVEVGTPNNAFCRRWQLTTKVCLPRSSKPIQSD